jgi:predicted nuclease with TOPRIM domain
MKKLLIVLPFFFSACDDNVVSRTEYDVMLSEKKELEGLNDSLQFELSSLRTYVECLEEDNAELVEELRRTPSDQQ